MKKYLLTIFDHNELPKERYFGTLIIDKNTLCFMEQKGYKPIYRKIEVPEDVFNGIRYSPVRKRDNYIIKYSTIENIQESRYIGHLTDLEYNKLMDILPNSRKYWNTGTGSISNK